MSYTYHHVIVCAALSAEECLCAVADASPCYASSGVSDVWVVPTYPKAGVTVLELAEHRGRQRLTAEKGSHRVPAAYLEEQPFLVELAYRFAGSGRPATAAVVTDQVDGFVVVTFGESTVGARLSPSLLGRGRPYRLTDLGEAPDPNASEHAASLLSSAVSETFLEPLQYLQWYADWSELWLSENWRSVSFPPPLRLVPNGSRLGPPQPMEASVVWEEYFPQ
jgi:hypothetical protein